MISKKRWSTTGPSFFFGRYLSFLCFRAFDLSQVLNGIILEGEGDRKRSRTSRKGHPVQDKAEGILLDIGFLIPIAIPLLTHGRIVRDTMEDDLEEMPVHAAAAIIVLFFFLFLIVIVVMFVVVIVIRAGFIVTDEIKDGIIAILKVTDEVAFLYLSEILLKCFLCHLLYLLSR